MNFIIGVIFIYLINYIFNDNMQEYGLLESIPYYLNEYVITDVIPYLLLCLSYFLILKKNKEDNRSVIISSFFNGVFIFLLFFGMIERKFYYDFAFLHEYESYDHIGLIVYAVIINIVYFVKISINRNNKTVLNMDENRLEKPEEKTAKKYDFLGKNYIKIFNIGFISTISVIIFRILYYYLMNKSI